MATDFVCSVKAEMYSLLDQLAELNGCSLEDEYCDMPRQAPGDEESEEGEPLSPSGGKAPAS